MRKWSFKEFCKQVPYSFLCEGAETSKAMQSVAWQSEVLCKRWLQV